MPGMNKGKAPAGLLGGALKKHAKDETNYGREIIDLPGGITGGIAQLVEAKIGKYAKGKNQGKSFLYLAGVVVEPEKATKIEKVWKDNKVQILSTKEVTVKGQRTSIMCPLCDTAKANGEVTSLDDNVANALNELRKLGGEDCTENVTDEESLQALLDALKEAGPYFKFSTQQMEPTAQYPNARVFENWYGGKDLGDDYQPESAPEGGAVEDDTQGAADEAPGDESAGDEAGEEDLAALAEAADGGDEDAALRLTELATEAGYEQEAIEGADSWAALVESMQAEGDEAGEAAEPEEVWKPKKNDNVFFKVKNKKTNRLQKTECQVLSVNNKKETVELQNLDNKKLTYKDVPWDELIVE